MKKVLDILKKTKLMLNSPDTNFMDAEIFESELDDVIESIEVDEPIKIGTRFIPVGRKNKAIRTVVDILKTYNSKGELVKTRYVSEHEFCGQMVSDNDVNIVTIQRGLIL